MPSPGGLRQYFRPAVVEAALIYDIAELDAVRITDNEGIQSTVTCLGLFDKGRPVFGDRLLLWPMGKTEWISAEEFAREWAPVRGSVLS